MARAAAACLMICCGLAGAAAADVREYLGRPLADVRIELAGQPLRDPAVLQLIETRIGDPLRIEQVRETIDHLVGLGRFEDVRVYAESSSVRPDAVTLRWALVPVQRIDRIEVAGDAKLPESAIRSTLIERIGTRPSASRTPELVDAVRAFYSDRGYRAPQIASRVMSGPTPELVTLELTVNAGQRTAIGSVAIKGHPPIAADRLIGELDVQRGRAYDGPAIAARLSRYEADLRDSGYYEASVDSEVAFSEDNLTADLTLDVEPGPHVSVVFAGDPLPQSRRDALVSIRQERSVDLDLLEDASRNIEGFLRQQGYRSAQAPYTREQRGNEMVLTFNVTRGPLHTLAAAEVAGNSVLPTAEFTGVMQLQRGEAFVDGRVAAVASAIAELYHARGFARATVKPDIVTSGAGQGARSVTVRFVITEGPQTMVGTVVIEGASVVSESAVRDALKLTTGRPFYRPVLDADHDAIERLYRNQGYQEARILPQWSLSDDGRRADVRWIVREGARTTIDHVLVTGNVRTSSELILREIPLQPGKALAEDAIVESQQRLAALGLFRRVRIVELPHGASTNRDVLIEVEEAPSTDVSEGGGVEAIRRLRRPAEGGPAEARFEVAPRAFFQVSRRNLWGKNRSLTLFTRVSFRPSDPDVDLVDPADQGGYGFNEYRFVATFREPRPLDKPGEGQLTAFFEQAIRTSFNFTRRGGRAEYARRVGTAFTVSGRYTFEHTRLFDQKISLEDRLPVDRLFGLSGRRLSTFTASVLRDSRNDVLDPERGALVGVDSSLAMRAVGSEVGFTRTYLQGSIYRRLPGAKRFVVAAASKIGLAKGFERLVPKFDAQGQPVPGPDGQPIVEVSTELPASERFFAGGDTTVRGFVLDQLGREDTLNDENFPAGGNGLIVLNLELRAPYWKSVGAVAFFDTGNVFKRASELNLTDLRPSAGFGVRYRSPVGPLRVDLGFNLDPRDLRGGGRERRSVLHISLGQAF